MLVLAVTAVSAQQPSPANGPRAVRIASLVALTGPVASLGTSSRALMAAARHVNASGGVRLSDGGKQALELTFLDDESAPTRGLTLLNEVAASDAVLAVDPTCSAVAEAIFSTLQKRVDDPADSGRQLPVFTDGTLKAGLASMSEWAFRNVANEDVLYREFWGWLRPREPALRTVFGGEEADFAHSHSAWDGIIRVRAADAGYTMLGSTQWSISDRVFQKPVAAMRDSVQSDRRHIRAALARLDIMPGLLGTIRRTRDREENKPYVFVEAQHDRWNTCTAPCRRSAHSGSSPFVIQGAGHGH